MSPRTAASISASLTRYASSNGGAYGTGVSSAPRMRTGGLGESLAAIIQEEAFEALDAPIRILAALDTPVPYSPPLEEFFLVSESQILASARLLSRY